MILDDWRGKTSYAKWRHRRTTLNPDIVRLIRASNEPNDVLAERLNVSITAIRKVKKKELWKWVEDEEPAAADSP